MRYHHKQLRKIQLYIGPRAGIEPAALPCTISYIERTVDAQDREIISLHLVMSTTVHRSQRRRKRRHHLVLVISVHGSW
jgi:hypothetical protein